MSVHAVEVLVTLPPTVIEVPVGPRGPRGESGSADEIASAVASYLETNPSPALAAHITAPRPHTEAESGKDFAAWFNALTI